MSELRTVELGRLSWEEVAELIPRNPIVLLPIGTVEQHGPHLPVNADNMVAHFVATRAAEQAKALAVVAPGINYGCSAVFSHFPGTYSIRPETLAQYLRDVCNAFIAQGFRRFIFVNNHGGNEGVCEQVARELKAAHGLVIGNIYPWFLGYNLMRDTYEDVEKAYGHGAEPETSAMMAMFPEDVVKERMASGTYQTFAGWEPVGYSKVKVPGQSYPGTVYLDSDEVAPNGVTGDPSLASAERGQIWIERIVGFAVAFIDHFDALTANADWAQVPAETGIVKPRQ